MWSLCTNAIVLYIGIHSGLRISAQQPQCANKCFISYTQSFKHWDLSLSGSMWRALYMRALCGGHYVAKGHYVEGTMRDQSDCSNPHSSNYDSIRDPLMWAYWKSEPWINHSDLRLSWPALKNLLQILYLPNVCGIINYKTGELHAAFREWSNHWHCSLSLIRVMCYPNAESPKRIPGTFPRL